MTSIEFDTYRVAVYVAFKDYASKLVRKTKIRKINIQDEFDTKYWILSKMVLIITLFEYNDRNYFDEDEMLQWQDIMNDIMGTKLYVDFKVI